MNDSRALAKDDVCFRPAGDCLAPDRFGQYVTFNPGQLVLDFAGSVQHVDAVSEMRVGFQWNQAARKLVFVTATQEAHLAN